MKALLEFYSKQRNKALANKDGKAFEVLKDGEHKAWFCFKDDAEYYIENHS